MEMSRFIEFNEENNMKQNELFKIFSFVPFIKTTEKRNANRVNTNWTKFN